MTTGIGGAHSSHVQASHTNYWRGFYKNLKTILSSLTASVQRNQFGTTRKQILLNTTVKSAISDVYLSFLTRIWSDSTLDSLGKTFLILQWQLRGYESLDPPMKHEIYIPAKPELYIYNKTNTHVNIEIGKLLTGAFFFGIRSSEYSTTPKEDNKWTRLLNKEDKRFTANAVYFHTKAGYSIWKNNYPQHSALKKMVSKIPKWQNGRQTQTSARCKSGQKSSSDWNHTP